MIALYIFATLAALITLMSWLSHRHTKAMLAKTVVGSRWKDRVWQGDWVTLEILRVSKCNTRVQYKYVDSKHFLPDFVYEMKVDTLWIYYDPISSPSQSNQPSGQDQQTDSAETKQESYSEVEPKS